MTIIFQKLMLLIRYTQLHLIMFILADVPIKSIIYIKTIHSACLKYHLLQKNNQRCRILISFSILTFIFTACRKREPFLFARTAEPTHRNGWANAITAANGIRL